MLLISRHNNKKAFKKTHMLALPLQPKYTLLPLLLILTLIAIHFSPLNDSLAYHRADFSLSMLLSMHLTHSNAMHLLLNSLGLALVWLLFAEHFQTYRLFLYAVIISLGVGLGVHLWSLNIAHYYGLSGVLHGLIFLGALFDIYRKERTGYAIALGVAVKVGYEHFVGASAALSDLIAAKVAVSAHFYGTVMGGMCFIGYLLLLKYRQRAQKPLS